MKVTILTNYDDWEALYINGELMTTGYQVTRKELIGFISSFIYGNVPCTEISYEEREFNFEYDAPERI